MKSIKQMVFESLNESKTNLSEKELDALYDEILRLKDKIDNGNKSVISDFNHKVSTLTSNGVAIEDWMILESLTINESEITSDKDFIEYGEKMLKQAHGDDYDQDTADDTLQGILKDADGDYGQAVGTLQSSMSESLVNEAQETVIRDNDRFYTFAKNKVR